MIKNQPADLKKNNRVVKNYHFVKRVFYPHEYK